MSTLTVVLPETVTPPWIKDVSVEDSLVHDVSVRATPAGTALLIRLVHPAPYDMFTLRAAEGRPDRLVLDVKRLIAPAVRAQEESLYAALKAGRTRIIAIDPGHGGEDYGAIGPDGIAEKDVCLAIAESLASRLSAIPGFHAVLTRQGDYFVPLRERTRIARRAHADLFMSIHANASRNRAATGTEVYFLSPRGATDELARATAERENEADLVGGLPARTDSEVGDILLDLAQTAAVERSGVLAEAALDHLATAPRVTTRGVKQAGFVVLKTVDVPSILVETAFISNLREERQLADGEFRRDLADRLSAAIVGYFARYHGE
jgi:N-acetylmuramoyl-L-alanine amidase